MTGSAWLTFIATVLAVQPGTVEIDLGKSAGLLPGDEGVVFYEIVVDNEVRAIDIDSAQVIEVSPFTATLGITTDSAIQPGFLVRFNLPRARIDGSRSSDPAPPLAPESANQSVSLNVAPKPPIAQFSYIRGTRGRCLKLRSQPSEASQVHSCVPEGSAVGVLEAAANWTRARLEDGTEGWLASRYLAASPPPPPPKTSAEPDAETTDAQALLEELEQAEARVDVQLRRLEQSQAAFHEAHEAHNELSRRLLEATVASYESKLTATGSELEQTQRQREEFAERYQSLKKEFIAKDDALAKVESERRLLIQKLEATNSELVEIEKTATKAKQALELELSSSEAAAASLRSRLEQREAELAATRTKLEQAQVENLAIARELEAADSKSRSSLETQLEAANLALAETQREKQALEAWLEERTRDVEKAEARVAIMQSEIDRLELITPRTRRDIENTRALLAAAERRARDLETQLAAREEESRAVESELEVLRRSVELREVQPDSSLSIESPSNAPVDGGANFVVLGSAKPCLNFRAEPKLDGPAFDCLEPGTRLGALGHWEGWHYVELVDGRSGWVSSRHLGRPGNGESGS